MTSWRRRCAATACAALISCAAVTVTPSPVTAAAGYINCAGTTQVTYNPGITLEPKPVHATETNRLNLCTSTVPGLVSGMNVLEYQADWSCLTVLHSGPATYAFEWNNGTSSTLSINFTVTSGGGQVVSTVHGSVVAGVLDGAAVEGTWTFLQPNAVQCATPEGITEEFGTVTLTIGDLGLGGGA